jgi:hypothetical protein
MSADPLSIVIVAEGSSDSALEWPIRWLFKELGIKNPLEIKTSFRSHDSKSGLKGKLRTACQLFEPDLILVHRDSDGTSYKKRFEEIQRVSAQLDIVDLVPVVTVRMMEAWLLISEPAIRIASGNPQGRVSLNLPKTRQLEAIADPKSLLFELLKTASELKGRRLKKFSEFEARRITAEEIEDFSPLLQLSAFQALKKALKEKFSDIL